MAVAERLPAKYDRKVSFLVESGDYDLLDWIAAARGLTVADVLREAIGHYWPQARKAEHWGLPMALHQRLASRIRAGEPTTTQNGDH